MGTTGGEHDMCELCAEATLVIVGVSRMRKSGIGDGVLFTKEDGKMRAGHESICGDLG